MTVLLAAFLLTFLTAMGGAALAVPMRPFLASPQDSQDQLEVLYQNARRAEENNDFAAAAAAYQQILRIRPDLPEIRSNLGVAYYFQKRYLEAIEQFQRALRAKPQLVVPNFFLGVSYYESHDLRQAVIYLRKASVLQPQNYEARMYLAASYMRLGEYRKAVAQYGKEAESRSDDPEVYYGLGWCSLLMAQEIFDTMATNGKETLYDLIAEGEAAFGRGELESARKQFTKALALDPLASSVKRQLGDLDLTEKKWDQAVEDFQQALKKDPDDFRAAFGLAEAYLHKAEIRESLSSLEKAISVRPEFFEEPRTFRSPLTSEKLKVAMERLEAEKQEGSGAAREAAWQFERMAVAQGREVRGHEALDEQESFRNALGFLKARLSPHILARASAAGEHDEGMKLFLAKRYEAAEPLLAEILNVRRGDRRARVSLAHCYFETKRPEEAIDLLWPLDPLRGHDWEAAYWLGRSYQELATRALAHMIRLAPDLYRTHQLVAEFYRLKGDTPMAVEEYQRALQLQPNAPGLHLALGVIYTDELKYSQAITELEEELRISPSSGLAQAALGRIYAARHDAARAVSYLRAALEIDSSIPGAHSDLAKALQEQGKLQEALRELQKAASEDRDGSIHYRLFQLYKRLDKPSEANQALSVSEKLRLAAKPAVFDFSANETVD